MQSSATSSSFSQQLSGRRQRTVRPVLCVCTSQPTATSASSSLASGGGGGCLTLICPRTGSLLSSMRVSGDLSGRVCVGLSTLSMFPPPYFSSPSLHHNSGGSGTGGNSAAATGASAGGGVYTNTTGTILAMGFGATDSRSRSNKSDNNNNDDTYGMFMTIRTSSVPPILHWKCRLPESNMTAGLLVSPCGHYVVGASQSGTLYVWKTLASTSSNSNTSGSAGGALLRSIPQVHYRAITVMTWSSSSSSLCAYLMTGGADGMVHMFSLLDLVSDSLTTTVAPIRTWTRHHLPVTALVPLGGCHSGGGRVVSAGQDGQVILMELCSGRVLATLQAPGSITTLCTVATTSSLTSPFAGRLFAGGAHGHLYMMDWDQYAMHQTSQALQTKLHYTAGGGGQETTTTTTRNLQNPHMEAVFGSSSAAAYGNEKVENFDASTSNSSSRNEIMTEWQGHDCQITSLLAYQDDNDSDPHHGGGNGCKTWLISGDCMGTLRVWDAVTQTCVRSIQPWSSSSSSSQQNQQQNATNPQPKNMRHRHPVTCIRLVQETIQELSGLSSHQQVQQQQQSPVFQHSNHRSSSGSITKMISPLQKFPDQQQQKHSSHSGTTLGSSNSLVCPVPFLKSSGALNDCASASSFSYEAALMEYKRKKRRLERGGQTCADKEAIDSNNKTRKKKDKRNDDRDAVVNIPGKSLSDDDDNSKDDDDDDSGKEEDCDEVSRLKKELAEARSTIERWEAVNNKLLQRLQGQQEG